MKLPGFRNTAMLLAATSLIATQALAGNALSIRDLVGARASSGESALESRGFTHITTTEGEYNTKHAYWWNAGDKHCVHVETYDGRYTAITDATRADCHQKDNAGAAVGAAVGVALLGALLSHKSHHHDNDQHHADQVQEAQYERGYNDGLHGQSYHNYDRADAYSRGYEAGVQQNAFNTRHRNNHQGRGGYHPSVAVDDLNGARASSADDALRQRGFQQVDGFKSGNTAYTIWNRRDTRQCLQMTVAEGRVYDIRDIGTHPNCR